jgi:hypothetical protein
LFLNRRLVEPGFKLIKPFMAKFTDAEKQLTGLEYNKHKEKKMKSRLILGALDLSYDLAEEGAMSLKKHATRNSCHRCPSASQAAVPSVHLRRKHTAFSSRIEGRHTCQEVEQLTLSTNGHRHKLSRGRTLDTTASISCHPQTL